MQPRDYDDADPFVDDLLLALSNSRRRMLIRLVDSTGSLSLRVAAGYISIAEDDLETTDPDKVPTQRRKSVYVTLYQNHVPQLETSAVLEFDETTKTLTKGKNLQIAISILEFVDQTLS